MRDPKDPGTRNLPLPRKRPAPAPEAAPVVGIRLGYARVSTDDQNLDLQRDALYAAGCAQIYEEVASGKDTKHRPELANVIRAARPGDTIVVWRLDRLGRSMSDLVHIVDNLHRNGIRFESLNERIDTTSAAGELIFHVFASLAQFERALTLERTHAGLQAARAQGRNGGRKPSLTPTQIRQAKAALKDPTVSVQGLAETLKVGRATIYRNVDVAAIRQAAAKKLKSKRTER